MGEFHVEVVRVGAIDRHPNADTLSRTLVRGGYPVLFKTGEFVEGDLAVYVPVDAVVPEGDPRWLFLGEHRRIKARRLRGIFSMGLLTKPLPEMNEGEDVATTLGIVRYEPPEEIESGSDDERDPGLLPLYDIEGLRRWPNVLREGEEVVLTEKIHGENGRFIHDGTRLWCASRTRFKVDAPGSQWWRAARASGLEAKLATVPGIGFFGEVHGYTGNFPYGVTRGEVGIRFFDAIEANTRQWLDVDEFFSLCRKLELPTVPVLHRGPWRADLGLLAEGDSTLGKHVREGFVVRPVRERFDIDGPGRVILKLHGEGFLTRK